MINKKITSKLNYKISEDNHFCSILSRSERNYIIEKYREWKKCLLFNGGCVRLNEIKENTLILSKVEYYDILITSIIPLCWKEMRKMAEDNNDKELMKIIDKIKILELNNYNYSSIYEALSNNRLANGFGVSIMIKDKNDNYLIVKRNNKIVSSRNPYSTGAAGAIDFNDLFCIDPILKAIKREIKEELNLTITNDDIKLKEIVYGENPAITATVTIDNLFNFKKSIEKHSGFLSENSELYIVHKNNLNEFIKDKKMAKVSEYNFMSEIQ